MDICYWMSWNSVLVRTIFYTILYNYANGQLNGAPANGGKVATIGELPHAVIVHTSFGKCTGAIIHESWVLTAAHCVLSLNGEPLPVGYVRVTAGVIDFKEPGWNAQKRIAKQIVIHPDHKSSRLGKFDIALVKVDPFKLDEYVSVIQFSRKEWPQDQRMLNRSCVSAGWGMLEGRRSTSILHMQHITAKHGENSCPCIEKNYILKRTVCLAAEPRIGICFGDSGGALVCDNEIVGVAHMVMDKRSCSYFKAPDSTIKCESSYVYGIYMYTCPYLNWIKQYVPGVPPTPASCKATLNSKSLYVLWLICISLILIIHIN